MKVTTVRFGQDLWNLIENEANLAGISASQYVREATLARAAASAGARGEVPYTVLAASAREVAAGQGSVARRNEIEFALATLARAVAADKRDSSEAAMSESEQGAAHTRSLRKRAAAGSKRS